MIKGWIRLLAAAAAAMLFLTGCGRGIISDEAGQGGQATEENREENGEESGEEGSTDPDSLQISVMVDDAFFSDIHEKESFLKQLEEMTGYSIELIEPEGSSYYDEVEQTLNGSDWPDILLLDSSHYAQYAFRGVLWDMTKSYNHSFWKSNVQDQEIVESFKIHGKLYGIAPDYGNGYITYVKKAWLERCGLEVPRDFQEFLTMCDAFTNGDPDGNGIEGDTFALTAPGVWQDDAPYTGYLPEIFQDAYPGFYQGEDGLWRDGFTEEAMETAVWRLVGTYMAGYLDPEILDNDINSCYQKFRDDRCGAITGWSGAFALELQVGLETAGLSDELVALTPVWEEGTYRIQQPYWWCITTACEEPEKVFHFLGSMMDGSDEEFLWTYGVEGLHWSMEDGTIYGKSYEKGEFHGLRNRQRTGTVFAKAYLDPFFALVPLTSSTVSDPSVYLGEMASVSARTFRENRIQTPLVPYTEEMVAYYDALEELKKEIITDLIKGNLIARDAIKVYSSGQGAKWSQIILDALNGQ